MNKKEVFTVDEIRDKLAKYCAYQDRCHQEVERKLSEFNLISEARDEIIIYLIQNKFLNEERFAKSFARGKFNQKKWGRNKIIFELKKRKISQNLISVALQEIDLEDYTTALQKLATKKKNSLKSEKDSFKKQQKIKNYLLQKGYEYNLIEETLLVK